MYEVQVHICGWKYFIHVSCLVTSDKVVASQSRGEQSQDCIHPCRAHAVLSLQCNHYLQHIEEFTRDNKPHKSTSFQLLY